MVRLITMVQVNRSMVRCLDEVKEEPVGNATGNSVLTTVHPRTCLRLLDIGYNGTLLTLCKLAYYVP